MPSLSLSLSLSLSFRTTVFRVIDSTQALAQSFSVDSIRPAKK
jgi:hypothetical protein